MNWKCPYCGSSSVHVEGGSVMALFGKSSMHPFLVCGRCHKGFPIPENGEVSLSNKKNKKDSKK